MLKAGGSFVTRLLPFVLYTVIQDVQFAAIKEKWIFFEIIMVFKKKEF